VTLLLVVLLAGPLVERIPLAALAGVLMVTGVRMIEPHNVRAVVLATRSDALVLVVTALVTLAFDLILAVEVGIAVAAVLALRAVARTGAATAEAIEVDGDIERALFDDHVVAYRIDGAVFFGAAQRFLTELTAVSDVRVVVLRLGDVQVLDATGAQALGEIISELEARAITVLLQGVRPEHERTLTAVGSLAGLGSHRHVFSSLPDAIDHARAHAVRAGAA
jgi:sulfate permease, SulP family